MEERQMISCEEDGPLFPSLPYLKTQVQVGGVCVVIGGIVCLFSNLNIAVDWVAAMAAILSVRSVPYLIRWEENTHIPSRVYKRLSNSVHKNDPAYKSRSYRVFKTSPLKLLVPQQTLTLDRAPAVAIQQTVEIVNGVQRLTIEEAAFYTQPNSYNVCIGRSLTEEGNPPVIVNVDNQHMKFIGATQKGKSSMVEAFIQIIMRTHDTDHALFAFLDMENKTSHLLETSGHILEAYINDEWVPFLAQDPETVLDRLVDLLDVMAYRYQPQVEIENEPIVFVYLEEFLSLKQHFEMKVKASKGDQKDEAEKRFNQFIHAVDELARRGLKARIQLLICAQTGYRDEDLYASMVNVTSGMSFSVKTSTAMSAGFTCVDLLNRNAKEKHAGQGVAEFPGCSDLVLAPQNDTRKRLAVWREEQKKLNPQVFTSVPSITRPFTDRDVMPVITETIAPQQEQVKSQSTTSGALLPQQVIHWKNTLDDAAFTAILDTMSSLVPEQQVAQPKSEPVYTGPVQEQAQEQIHDALPDKYIPVLQAYERGITKTRDIAEIVSLGKSTVAEYLQELRRRGFIGINEADDE